MAFQESNTFVYGEQPSASKMDQLWRNDDAIYNGAFAAGAIDTDDVAADAITPAKRSGGFKVGTFTVTGDGAKAVTGVGFTPKKVRFTYMPGTGTTENYICVGAMDEDGNQYARGNKTIEGGDASGTDSTSLCGYHPASNAGQGTRIAYASMDADGFTVTGSNYANDATFAYEAEA